uniref:F-actin-monooxygenase MICAL3-like isoform X2 n=1 Tax=Myxine glutinosa TaxID=7769 RepID=UPI00358FC390
MGYSGMTPQRAFSTSNKQCLIIGAGPCGLRMSIELALLGATVVVVEKRDVFSRNNVLHLWPFTIHDLKALGAKKFYGKFCAGAIDHISIRQLQLMLLKVSLVVGVQIHFNVEFLQLLEPPEDQEIEQLGWRAEVNPRAHPVAEYEFDTIVGADGRRNTLEGFRRKEFRGKLAIAITANFINRHTREEAKVEEISGVAFIFNQKFFQDLRATTGIDLENIVYYKDDTHYFVMTAKKQSLLEKGAIRQDHSDTEMLLSRNNVNQEALRNYAIEAANFSTNNQLPDLTFAINHYGQPDVAMFDFTCMYASENAALVRERHGHRLLVGLVGDSLLEPFWPMGTGCARGFLAVFDLAWSIRCCAQGSSSLEVLAQRESIYRLLPQTTPENLHKNFNQYSVDPSTRYPNASLNALQPSQVKHLLNTGEHVELGKAVETVRFESGITRQDSLVRSSKLLSWCQRQTEHCPCVCVVDLASSWKSGLALCAIIHRYRPDLIKFDSLDESDVAGNNQLAFDVAEREFGISPIMTGKEMAGVPEPDKLSMVMYLTQFYELFKEVLPPEEYNRLMVDDKPALLPTKSPISFLSKLGQTISRKRTPKDKKEKESVGTGKRRRTRQKSLEEIDRQDERQGLGSSDDARPIDGPPGHQNKVKAVTNQLLAKFEENVPSQSGLKRQGSLRKEFPQNVGGSDVCYFCKQRVYVMERLSAEGKFFHRGCFKCDYCDVTLRLGNFAFDVEEGKFYCKPHFCHRKSGYMQRKRRAGELLLREDQQAEEEDYDDEEDESEVETDKLRSTISTGSSPAIFAEEEVFFPEVRVVEEPCMAKRARGTPERIELEDWRPDHSVPQLFEVTEEVLAEHNLSATLDRYDAAVVAIEGSSSDSELFDDEDVIEGNGAEEENYEDDEEVEVFVGASSEVRTISLASRRKLPKRLDGRSSSSSSELGGLPWKEVVRQHELRRGKTEEEAEREAQRLVDQEARQLVQAQVDAFEPTEDEEDEEVDEVEEQEEQSDEEFSEEGEYFPWATELSIGKWIQISEMKNVTKTTAKRGAVWRQNIFAWLQTSTGEGEDTKERVEDAVTTKQDAADLLVVEDEEGAALDPVLQEISAQQDDEKERATAHEPFTYQDILRPSQGSSRLHIQSTGLDMQEESIQTLLSPGPWEPQRTPTSSPASSPNVQNRHFFNYPTSPQSPVFWTPMAQKNTLSPLNSPESLEHNLPSSPLAGPLYLSSPSPASDPSKSVPVFHFLQSPDTERNLNQSSLISPSPGPLSPNSVSSHTPTGPGSPVQQQTASASPTRSNDQWMYSDTAKAYQISPSLKLPPAISHGLVSGLPTVPIVPPRSYLPQTSRLSADLPLAVKTKDNLQPESKLKVADSDVNNEDLFLKNLNTIDRFRLEAQANWTKAGLCMEDIDKTNRRSHSSSSVSTPEALQAPSPIPQSLITFEDKTPAVVRTRGTEERSNLANSFVSAAKTYNEEICSKELITSTISETNFPPKSSITSQVNEFTSRALSPKEIVLCLVEEENQKDELHMQGGVVHPNSFLLTPPSSPPPPPPTSEEPATLPLYRTHPVIQKTPLVTSPQPPIPPRRCMLQHGKSLEESIDDIPFADEDEEDEKVVANEISRASEDSFHTPPTSRVPRFRKGMAEWAQSSPFAETASPVLSHKEQRSPEEVAENRLWEQEQNVRSNLLREMMAQQRVKIKEKIEAGSISDASCFSNPNYHQEQPLIGEGHFKRRPGYSYPRKLRNSPVSQGPGGSTSKGLAGEGSSETSQTSIDEISAKPQRKQSLFSSYRNKNKAKVQAGATTSCTWSGEKKATKIRSPIWNILKNCKDRQKAPEGEGANSSRESSGGTGDSGSEKGAFVGTNFTSSQRIPVSPLEDDSELSSEEVLNPSRIHRTQVFTEEELNAKLTRRVQRAARKQAKQDELKRLHRAQIIQRQLEEVEEKQRTLEQHGVAVEKAIRGEAGLSKNDDPQLMQEWFRLVQEKNTLFRYESELMIFARELELEDRQSRLQQELRERMAVDDTGKSERELLEEKRILREMLEVVEHRDSLVALLEEQRLREKEEDRDIEATMLSRGYKINWT